MCSDAPTAYVSNWEPITKPFWGFLVSHMNFVCAKWHATWHATCQFLATSTTAHTLECKSKGVGACQHLARLSFPQPKLGQLSPYLATFEFRVLTNHL